MQLWGGARYGAKKYLVNLKRPGVGSISDQAAHSPRLWLCIRNNSPYDVETCQRLKSIWARPDVVGYPKKWALPLVPELPSRAHLRLDHLDQTLGHGTLLERERKGLGGRGDENTLMQMATSDGAKRMMLVMPFCWLTNITCKCARVRR